jgi:hypothetical protein
MDMITVQQEVAAAVVADNPYGEWERIVADVEIKEEETGYRLDTVSFAVVRKSDGSLTQPDFDLSDQARQAAIGLYKERLNIAGDKIGSFGLEIDRDGKYRFEISYDAPKRLNGEWDEKNEAKLNNYLATYKN